MEHYGHPSTAKVQTLGEHDIVLGQLESLIESVISSILAIAILAIIVII